MCLEYQVQICINIESEKTMKLFTNFDPTDNVMPLRTIKMAQTMAPSFKPPTKFNSLRVLVDENGKFEDLELFWDEEEALNSSTIVMSDGEINFSGNYNENNKN